MAGEMKDEYTSVEHLFLGLLDTAGRELAQLFSQYQITRERAPPGPVRGTGETNG